MEDNRVLLAQGALLKCSCLLVSLGAAVAEGNKEDGMELVGKKNSLKSSISQCPLLF